MNEELAPPTPLVAHLIELRRRLMWATAAVLIGFGACYAVKEPLFNLLVRPLAASLMPGQKLIFTGVPELFFTYLKLSFMGGLFIAFPVLLLEIWRFTAPGLYKNEKKALLPFVALTPLLFYLGGAFTYFTVMPIAIEFFFQFQTDLIEALPSVKEYLSFFIKMTFAFGLAFELPLLVLLLARAGLTTPEGLRRVRRFVIVGIFAFAAVVTPPDPMSQLILALPMWLLYEISIIGAWMMQKKKERVEAAGQ